MVLIDLAPRELSGWESESRLPMCPGRQTDRARQNLIRQFVSDGLKPTRPFRFSLATRVRHVGRDPRLIAHKQNGHRVGLASLMTGTLVPLQLLPLSSSRAKQPG
jgi:hypothetical protein